MASTRTQERRTFSGGRHVVVGLMLPLIAGYAALFAYAMQHTDYDTWGAIWLAPILVAISVPVLLRFARNEADPRIFRILVAALLLKLLAAVPRYYMVAFTYETGDSFGYADTATVLRQGFIRGDFDLTALGTDSRTGTQFIEIVTGVVYSLIGPTFVGGFVFFSWLCFWGLFYFYRAFRVAIPDGDQIRYAALVFFLPSMLFWPSSIGKEAWMTLALGLTAYGCALLFTHRRGASVYLLLGVTGIIMVRPHVALLVVAGLALGYMLRGFGAQRAGSLRSLRTLFGLAVIGGVTLLVIRQVSQFFGLDEFNVETATETLEYAEEQTGQGGSEYEDPAPPSLVTLPRDLITVLFRPFPFEVHNLQALLTALEGTVLLMLFILSWPRLRTVAKRVFRQPYVTFAVTYAVLFCFIFSSFQNFGILARERVMVYPFVVVLLALPLTGIRRVRGRRAELSERTTPDGDPAGRR
ncbi:MAG: hypothetical protein ACODAF_03785 [Actinomycetota bacterium]